MTAAHRLFDQDRAANIVLMVGDSALKLICGSRAWESVRNQLGPAIVGPGEATTIGSIRIDDPVAGPLPTPEREPDATLLNLRLWNEPTARVISPGQSLGVLRSEAQHVHVQIVDAPGWQETTRALTTAAIAAWASGQGWFSCHAAAACGPSGAVAIFGDSGAGKSTASAAAAAAGLALAGDDTLNMRAGAFGLEVCGAPLAPAFDADGIRALELDPVGNPDHRGRHRFPTWPLRAGWHPLRAIALAEHGSQPTSELAPLSRLEAALAVLASAAASNRGTDEVPDYQSLVDGLSDVQTIRLLSGADPTQRHESTGALLRGLVGA